MNSPNNEQGTFAVDVDLSVLRYSMVWEDHRVLTKALTVQPTDDVLSICAAGDNVLALALEGPRSVTAVDISPTQSALLALKIAAIRTLPHADFLALLGFRPSPARLALYDALRPALEPWACALWDRRRDLLAAGVGATGRLESYLSRFGQEVLPTVWTPDLIARLTTAPDLAAQAQCFREQANTEAFRAAFCAYFCADRIAREGRSAAQFRYVSRQDIPDYLLERFEHCCTRLLIRDNPYVSFMLLGRLREPTRAHPYLAPENYTRLRDVVSRVEIEIASVEQALQRRPKGTFSVANLSNIFEYMSDQQTQALLQTLAHTMRPDGRLAYWTLFTPRVAVPHLNPCLRPQIRTASALWQTDRVFFYSAFHLLKVAAEVGESANNRSAHHG